MDLKCDNYHSAMWQWYVFKFVEVTWTSWTNLQRTFGGYKLTTHMHDGLVTWLLT